MPFAISWSRLEQAEQCPLLCYWKNFAPKDQRVPFDDQAPHLLKGKRWHKWMEDACLGKAALPEEVKAFKPMVEAIRRGSGEVYVEHQLALTAKYNKCDWFARNAYWRTIFDLLKIHPNGMAMSLDWKTGKVKDKVTDQLKFSSAAAFLRWPEIKKIKSAYVWLEHDKQPPTVAEFDRKELPAIMDEFEERVEVVKIMHEDNSWEAKPSDFNCKWCPCTPAQCEHSRN
jgi:hypothetical protein